jgi:hypothetical protein
MNIPTLALTASAALLTFCAFSGNSTKDADNGRKTVFTENSEWKAVDMADIQVKEGTALDLSKLLEEGPAGQHGRAIINKRGALAFERSPDIPRRFFAFTGFFKAIRTLEAATQEETAANMERFAELARRQGYNLVRPLVSDSYLMEGSNEDGVFNPVKQAVFDKLLFELKKQGVYSYMTIAAYRCGLKDRARAWDGRNEFKLKMFLGDKETRDNWRRSAQALLNHVNPHTGLALKDDPSVVCVEIYNEQELGFGATRLKTMSPDAQQELKDRWNSWLKAKVSTPAALAKAYGVAGGFDSQEPDQEGPLANEFNLFAKEISLECMAWCEKALRETGYKGLVSQYNFAKSTAFNAVRWESSPVVSTNYYFKHPTQFSKPGSRCEQNSSAGAGANYWRSVNATRLAGRPLFVTEHNHSFWNRYQHEDGLLFASYSAFQGFSSVMVHEDAVALKVTQPNIDFSVASSPVARANEFVAACLYLRGDVAQAVKNVQLQIPDSYLRAAANKAVNGEQNKIALITGFSVAFPGLKAAAGLPPTPKPDMALAPVGGSEIRSGEWSSSIKDSTSSQFSISLFVKTLKTKGILPAANISDPEKGVFQSETGEITLRTKENLIKVVTPKSEGVSLEAGKSEKLDCMTVDATSVPASIAVCAMDGQALKRCARAVIVYSTEIANSGMELSEDRVTMITPGELPTLMLAGRLDITLKNSNGAKMALYALGYNGVRRERLPLRNEGGLMKISIDTGTLRDGPTPFFELVAE